MFDVSFSTKMYALTIIMFFAPVQAQSLSEKIYQNKRVIAAALLIAGTAATAIFGVPYLLERYHNNEMLQARTRLSTQKNHEEFNNIFAQDSTTKTTLTTKKSEVTNSWKNNWQRGLSLAFSQTFSGNFNIANALCLNLTTNGAGILQRCFVRNHTEFNDNIIASASQFKGNVVINQPASVAAFNNCLLGTVQCNNTTKNVMIVELCNTIVDGDIRFAHPGGVVVIDQETIIGGAVINGTIVHQS